MFSGTSRGCRSITSEIFRRTEVNYAYNGKIYDVSNTFLRILCTRNDITYWSHRGLWQNTPDLLLNDLVHLNQEGLEIYARNVRAAVGSRPRCWHIPNWQNLSFYISCFIHIEDRFFFFFSPLYIDNGNNPYADQLISR